MRHKRSRLVLRKRAAPGAAPGVLVADPGAAATVLRVLAIAPDGVREVENATPAAVEKLRRGGGLLWVDVVGLADHATIQAVAAAFGLHPLAVEDITNTHQRPKAETYEDHLFIVFRRLEAGGPIDGEQICMVVGQGAVSQGGVSQGGVSQDAVAQGVVGPEGASQGGVAAGYVLTFSERPPAGVGADAFEPVRERLRRGRGRIRAEGADYLAYALIDAAIDGYFPALEGLGETLEALEDAVVARPVRRHVEELHRVKRDLLALRRAIWPMREMLNALLRDDVPAFRPTTRPYLRDSYDHVVQLMDIIETYREIASGLLDVYLSSLSTRLNEVMKVLTIIATIFMPMSFVASLYGMNFATEHPWNMPELDWPLGYPFALLLMAGIAFGLLAYFRRKGWLGKDEDGRG